MPIIQPTPPVAVQISARPDTPPIVVQAYVDPNSAPPGSDPSGVAFGLLCLAVAWNRQVLLAIANRVAMLEIHAAETESAANTADACAASMQRKRLALAAITAQANLLEINTPEPLAPPESSAPASALDAIDPSSLGG